MSTSPTQPDATETEDLVAYLDGELSDEDCRRIERRLASDADYRRRLTELEQAWTALDALPPTVVDDDFARTTIEMVCVAAERDEKQESSLRMATGKRRRLAMFAGGAAIALAAFAATRFLAPGRDQALVSDLPVVAHFDVLSDVGDLEFLRGLEKLDLDPTTRSMSTELVAVNPSQWETMSDRRAWVESLSAGEKAELAGKFARFERETPQAREQLRQLAREIETAKDHQELNTTLTSYGQWLQSRTPAERAGLRDLSDEARLKRVEQLVEQSQRSLRRQLSLDDEKALQEAILSLVEERRHEILDEVRERGNPNPEERIGELRVSTVAWAIIGRDMQNEKRRKQLENRLMASLSDEAQAYLDELDGWQRQRQLGRWVFEALSPKFGPQNLEEFFANSLTNDDREYLLGLPRTEMEERLQQMYARSQVGLRDDGVPRRAWWDWPGDRGPRGRDGDRDRDDRGRRDGRGRGERDQFDGPPGDFGGRRFNGPPPGGRRGPGGPGHPNGPPPFGPPPRDGERPFGPPPGEGGPPPADQPPP